MALNPALFSSNKDEWETPWDFFNRLNEEFHFDIDVCALPHNAKCPRYFTPEDDALKQEWRGTCWMNPPYGIKVTGKWVKKAYEEAQKEGTTVVCLLPARTDTEWWHQYCMKGEIRFVKGRLKFIGAEYGAPFPSVVVVFGEKAKVGKMSSMTNK